MVFKDNPGYRYDCCIAKGAAHSNARKLYPFLCGSFNNQGITYGKQSLEKQREQK